ncbi:MAG: RNA-directed DNA polymerase [Crocinitomicaceae bacterium]|nr:retron St85 family RNA-directed DNA polymerase [Flavobacteriales bacterium]NQZ36930.1 RNA-directed DNA polymerase [Crocinitomicaceae bacterium]
MKNNYSIEDWEKHILENTEANGLERVYYLETVKIAYQNNVPVILDVNHLAKLLGLKVGIVTSMIYGPHSFYRTFDIPKKKGGVRTIVAPYTSLLYCQRWISDEILSRFFVHDAAYAYRPNRNIVMNAEKHVGQKYMLKLDLVDFFGNITESRVRSLFQENGYDKGMSFFLAGLCCLDGVLPQGAATSPSISNIVLNELDHKFDYLCDKYGVVYTRYADDLVFSSDSPLDHIVDHIGDIIKGEGFTVNIEKSKIYTAGANKLVTGLAVQEDRVRLPKRKRRKIRQEVYFVKKNGIMKEVERSSDLFALERVLGKLYFWKQVEPNNEYVLGEILELKKMRKELLRSLTSS